MTVRNSARTIFCKHIDSIITTSYGSEFCITHKCHHKNNDIVSKHDTPDKLFQEQNTSIFCHERHKELCTDIQGKVMWCSDCQQTISESDIVNQSLQQLKKYLVPGEWSQHNRPDTIIPLSKERLDMAAYTFTYHMETGCAQEKDPFWGNVNVQELLLKYRFEDHLACHKASCFKKGCDCRLLFPFMLTTSKYMHEDKGDKNEKKYCGIH